MRSARRHTYGVSYLPYGPGLLAIRVTTADIGVSRSCSHSCETQSSSERMTELERRGVHGNPKREMKVWLDKLAEIDSERRSYIKHQGLVS